MINCGSRAYIIP